MDQDLKQTLGWTNDCRRVLLPGPVLMPSGGSDVSDMSDMSDMSDILKGSIRRNVEEEQRVQRVPSRVVSLDDVSQRMSQLSSAPSDPRCYMSEGKGMKRSKPGQ